MSYQIKVDSFPLGGTIPIRHTCEGANTSPAIHWSGAPPNTLSFALLIDDPDAPAGVWTHWLLWDIPPTTHQLKEGVLIESPIQVGRNDFGHTNYGGPCPPRGRGVHRYFFHCFALDTKTLPLATGADREEFLSAVKPHSLAKAEYMGRFGR